MDLSLLYKYLQTHPSTYDHRETQGIFEIPVKEEVFILLTPWGEWSVVQEDEVLTNPPKETLSSCITYALEAMMMQVESKNLNMLI